LIPVISIIGHHNAGKTLLLSRLIESLTERGLVVGAVKHAPHLDDLDARGSDSDRFREVGADRVLLLGRTTASLTWDFSKSQQLEDHVDSLFLGCDLVLVEGLKSGPFPKIEVYRRNREIREDPLAGEIDVFAVVSDESLALPDGTRQFGARDAEAIADMLEAMFLAP